MKIYEFIVANGRLTDDHRNSLKKQRGFTDELIGKYRFISGGKHILELEQKILETFSETELMESGICINDGKALHLSPMLTEDRIIIPYLDKNQKCYYLRPHKLGLKGLPVEIYHEATVGRQIILTEGEFKAVACEAWGINAIAIPGIGSFSDSNFQRLVKFLNTNGVREICIIFDNEVKDDPQFPGRFKENPINRYDTQFYSFFMAKLLVAEGFDCRIGWLPDGWRTDGKIDLDGALSQGKTADDIKRIIGQSKIFKNFVEDLPKEVQDIIKKKIAKKYFRTHIRKEFGKYIATRHRGKTEWDETISNFTIKVIATHETQNGIIREICFTNEFGQSAPFFTIGPEDMYGPDGFGTFCLGHGNYIWRGNKDDLINIWEQEFLEDDGRHIIEPDHIGWIDAEKMWLFGNVAVREGKEGSKEMRPDKNHIFWTEKKGIKPIPLGISSGRNTISEGIPYLTTTPFYINQVREKLGDSIGQGEASKCLGWVTAVIFQEEIFELYGCFPFLFITGRRSSGKSTIAEWLMNFFGLENAGKMASDTTAVGIQRYMAYYSSLPVFLDEYRNTKQITMKNGFLRNAYNRQSAGKGIKADFGIREAKIRGTLMIAGEETPEDNALLTRCIIVVVSEKNRKENHFNWFMASRTKFSYHVLDIIRRKNELKEKFFSILNEGKNYFVTQGIDDRTAINYAVVAAGHFAAFGENLDFSKFLSEEAKRAKMQYQDEQAVAVFLEDLVLLKTRRLIDENYYELSDGTIYLYFHGVYSIWSQEYRKTRGIEPFKASSILDYLKEEPGFVDSNYPKKIKGQLKKCAVFVLDEAPEQLRSLVTSDEPQEVTGNRAGNQGNIW